MLFVTACIRHEHGDSDGEKGLTGYPEERVK